MSANIHQDKILILDFGSQYTQLIARRVREIGVYSEVWSASLGQDLVRIKTFNPRGIILAGSPESLDNQTQAALNQDFFTLSCPILGICFGMQTMAVSLGGLVKQHQRKEFGKTELNLLKDTPLTQGLSKQQIVWMSHGDQVTSLPPGFISIASSANCAIAAMANPEQKQYGLQFHPEVTHTEQGKAILKRFVLDICQCETHWQSEHIAEELIDQIKKQLGDQHVLLALSGGVDSTVTAQLLYKAIGKQLTAVFVDNGLLRKNEAEQVSAIFSAELGEKFIQVDARDTFLNKLQNVEDPEHKRKIIGHSFIEVFEQQASQLKNIQWLAQGTIYSDVIESAASATGKAQVIKSHHNVGGLPENMRFKIIEPLRELFKDEVRELGLSLGLKPEAVYRHPFPGPGLGVRVLGEVKPEYLEILREADAIFIEELRKSGWYSKVSQAFAVFLPVKAVGVVGDARAYDYVISLRAVETTDFMTAKWSHLPYELLEVASSRIINEVAGVSRVTYDISSKPPATIEWE